MYNFFIVILFHFTLLYSMENSEEISNANYPETSIHFDLQILPENLDAFQSYVVFEDLEYPIEDLESPNLSANEFIAKEDTLLIKCLDCGNFLYSTCSPSRLNPSFQKHCISVHDKTDGRKSPIYLHKGLIHDLRTINENELQRYNPPEKINTSSHHYYISECTQCNHFFTTTKHDKTLAYQDLYKRLLKHFSSEHYESKPSFKFYSFSTEKPIRPISSKQEYLKKNKSKFIKMDLEKND